MVVVLVWSANTVCRAMCSNLPLYSFDFMILLDESLITIYIFQGFKDKFFLI